MLLLLHGLGSSSLDWQAQIERFSEHYRVVALDLRGHGQSMQEGPFDVATLAADVVNWLDDSLSPPGWSGSWVPWWRWSWRCNCRTRCRGWCWSTASANFCWRRQRAGALCPAPQVAALVRPAAARLVARPRAFPGPDLAQVRHTFRLRFVRNKKKTYKALLEALPGWSVRARLGNIWQPVAIISTSHDYLPLAKRVEQLPPAQRHHPHPQRPPRLAGGRSSGFNHLLQRILSTH